jgi:autotransporter-associated beta strand protein
MKPKINRIILTASSALLLAPAALALDGTWTNLSGGAWPTSGNWSASTVASGSGFTANFNTLDITADVSVNLDGARTIGNLIFGDTDTTTAAGWTINTGTGGSITLAGTSPNITVNALGTSKTVTIAALLAGSAGFTKDGAGTLRLTNGSNTISGPIVVSAGTLTVGAKSLSNATTVAINAGSLISATTAANAIGGTISFGGGTLQYNQAPGTDYSAQFSTTANQQYRINVQTALTATYASDLASAGGILSKTGPGTLILSAANTFTGATTLSGGNLQLNNALALQNSAINTAASIVGTTTAGFVLNAVTSPTFGGLTGNKQLSTIFDTDTGNYGLVTNVTLNPGTGASYDYSGVLNNGASDMTVTKTGAGTQTLSGANTYTGGTIVSNGTLVINGSTSTTGTVTVGAGGTLAGIGTVGAATTVNGTLSPGQSPGTMTYQNTLTLAGSTIMEIDGTSGAGVAGGHDFVNLTGAGAAGVLTHGGTMTLDIGVIFGTGGYSWNLFDFASETGTFTGITLSDQYSGSLLDPDMDGVWGLTSGINTWTFTESTGVLNLTVVPEPSSLALLGLGGLGLALVRRRRGN